MALLFHNTGGMCREGSWGTSGGALRGQFVCELVSGWACKLDGASQSAVSVRSVPKWVKLEWFQDSCGKRSMWKMREEGWVAHASDTPHSVHLLVYILDSWVWMRSVHGCWRVEREREREREKGVYLEKSRIKRKKWQNNKGRGSGEFEAVCVWGGSQCLHSGLEVSHKTQNQRGWCDKYFLSKISCLM